MSRLSKSALLLFVVATLAGACLHFVYALFPNAVTACFSPVQESLWEHLKLLYWPYLAACLLLARNEGWDTLRVRALTLLLCCAAALAAGWLYHIILGGEALFFDVALYVLTMAAAFLLPGLLRQFPLARRGLWLLLAVALGAAILLFTFLPPSGPHFLDLTAVNTWHVLPC